MDSRRRSRWFGRRRAAQCRRDQRDPARREYPRTDRRRHPHRRDNLLLARRRRHARHSRHDRRTRSGPCPRSGAPVSRAHRGLDRFARRQGRRAGLDRADRDGCTRDGRAHGGRGNRLPHRHGHWPRSALKRGVNLELSGAIANAVSIPFIASGGVKDIEDITALKTLPGRPIHGCILGRALYDGDIEPRAALEAAAA